MTAKVIARADRTPVDVREPACLAFSMALELSDTARARLMRHLQTLFATEFDENLSAFQAEQIVVSMLAAMGPEVYNQALRDMRAFFQARVDDLEGELFIDPSG